MEQKRQVNQLRRRRVGSAKPWIDGNETGGPTTSGVNHGVVILRIHVHPHLFFYLFHSHLQVNLTGKT